MPVPWQPETHFISSPYNYEDYEEFYNNGNILNSDLDEEKATYGAAYNRYKKYLRKAYEAIIKSAQVEPFKLIKLLDPPRPMRSYLP